MNLPKAPQYMREERAGILAVAGEVNRLGLIWRETPMTDVGIDGQIELVDDVGQATGRMIAVQVKSGQSYFHDHGFEWRFNPAPKHREYWEQFPLPVIIALHSPKEHQTYWTDARQALRSPDTGPRHYIAIPKQNVLQRATADELFATTGASVRPFLAISAVLQEMATSHTGNASFPITYLDLFANGLTNIVRSVYYGVDLAMEVATVILEPSPRVTRNEVGIGIGQKEHDFLFDYVRFLVAQNLADVDISDCLIEWNDRQMHPTFVAPLTARGRALVDLIDTYQAEMEANGRLANPRSVRVAQEGLVQMYFAPSHYARMPFIRDFRKLLNPTVAPVS